MKQKKIFDRFLSAVLVLFGFANFMFAGGTITLSGNVEQTHNLSNPITIYNYRTTGVVDLITITVPAAGTVTIDPNDSNFYSLKAGFFRYMLQGSKTNPTANQISQSGINFKGPITFTINQAGTAYLYLLLNDTSNNNKTLSTNATIKFVPTNPDPTNNSCKALDDDEIGGENFSLTYNLSGITKYNNGKYTGFYGEIEAEDDGTVTIQTDGNCDASLDISSPSSTDCAARGVVSREVKKDQEFYIRVSPNSNSAADVGKSCQVKVLFTPSGSNPGGSDIGVDVGPGGDNPGTGGESEENADNGCGIKGHSNTRCVPPSPASNEHSNNGEVTLNGFQQNYSNGICYNQYGRAYSCTVTDYVKDFTEIGDYRNQQSKVRFGGAGTYVFGDYAMTGNTVLKPTTATDNDQMHSTDAVAKREHARFNNNSSKATLKLPKGVKADDIVYARLYWQGHIFNTNASNGLSQLSGYQDVEFMMKSSAGGDSEIYPLHKDKCNGVVTATTYGNGAKLRMTYACSLDVTNIVRENFKDYSDGIDFTVGNIKTSTGKDPGNAVYISGQVFNGVVLGPYGGWGIVVVYDKNGDSRKELVNDLKAGKVLGIPAMSSTQLAKDYTNAYFKPKNVTIYGDYIHLAPWDHADPTLTNIKLSGFYTPKYGEVTSKLSFLGFAGEKDFQALEYFRVVDKNNRWQDLHGERNTVNQEISGGNYNIFDGSISLLDLVCSNGYKTCNYQYRYPSSYRYNLGLDLDEFPIGQYLKNEQTSLDIQLGAGKDRTGADQEYVSMIAVSVDLYTPKLCYRQQIFNAKNWVKFFDSNTGLRKDAYNDSEKPYDIYDDKSGALVTGENLFYRVRFENQNNGESDDASKVVVSVNFNDYNTYQLNSSAIDNTLSSQHTASAPIVNKPAPNDNFVYLMDNSRGAYDTQKNRANASVNSSTGNVGSSVYNGKQMSSYANNILNFYIGEKGGTLPGPVGGEMKVGKEAYVEFNSTVGRNTAYFEPPTYSVGYKLLADRSLGDSEANVMLDFTGKNSIEMDMCPDEANTENERIDVLTLNGLQIVNQNFKENGDDDRLYTQIAELPFDVKMIYRPDYSGMFDCVEWNADKSECLDYGSRAENVKGFKADADGKIKHYKTEIKLEKFELKGKTYLSVINASNAGQSVCKLLTNTYKIPFYIGNKRYETDYEIDFHEKILEIKNLSVDDAHEGLSFMISYRPDGLSTYYASKTYDVENNATDSYITVNGEKFTINTETSDYFLEQYKISLLMEKGYFSGKTDKQKEQILEEVEAQMETLKAEIVEAERYFGTAISPDGTFHVCSSDFFSVRPAYFEFNRAHINKFAKFVDLDKAGDITDKGDATNTLHSKDLRIGGDYAENEDVLYNALYAKSINGNPVPGYYAVLGGDLGTSNRFSLRNGYSSDDFDKSADIKYKTKEQGTYIKPFISNDCSNMIESQSFYIDRKTLKNFAVSKKDECLGGKDREYHGYTHVGNGKYEYIKDYNIEDKKFGTSKDADGCSTGAKNFEEEYFRLWDKNGVSMAAAFNVIAADVTGGEAVIKSSVTPSHIAKERRKATGKENRAALLYTNTTKEEHKFRFNYYNVGDALVKLNDNSWTDAYDNQTYSKQWGSAKCIINSTSNVPVDGKIGCDIGMKDNRSMVLRYQPDRIQIALASLKNADTINGYTYFNSPDIENNLGDFGNAQNKSVTTQTEQMAELEFDGVAFLSNKVYPNVVATLYDGRLNSAGTAAACGFASALNVGLNFTFDCENTPVNDRDGRCINVAPQSTAADVNYNPYWQPAYAANAITIPANTEFFTDQACRNNNGGSDSRCFKYNVKQPKDGFYEEMNAPTLAGYNLPVPLKNAINFYTSAGKDKGFINLPDSNPTASIRYNPKSENFQLLPRGFAEGKTPGATVFFNFDRMHKTAHRPLYIYVKDFTFEKDAAGNDTLSISDKIQPASFNSNGEIESNNAFETYNNSILGNKLSSENFTNYINRVSSEEGFASAADYISAKNAGGVVNVGTFAMFVYGAANEINNGRDNIVMNVRNNARNIDIVAQLYCGQADNCQNIPTPNSRNDASLGYMAPTTNIFQTIQGDGGEISQDIGVATRNTTLHYTSENNMKLKFVNSYQSSNNGVTVNANNRNMKTAVGQGGSETISVSAQRRNRATIRVITQPWLIYTPHIRDIYTDNANAFGHSNIAAGVPQYNNYFNVVFNATAGNWAGEGGVKSGQADDVGSFISGQNFNDMAGDSRDDKRGRDTYNRRIDW